jgi:hypothetical protein
MPTISANGFESLELEDPSNPHGLKYGYGISLITFGPNNVYFHDGEPVNDVTLIVWTNLTLSLDGPPTANTIMIKMLDQIYAVSPL